MVLEEFGTRVVDSETLHGTRHEWYQKFGLRGRPIACSGLDRHRGLLTLRLQVHLATTKLTDVQDIPVWTDFVSKDFSYLLLTAAGSEVRGSSGTLVGDDWGVGYAGVCSQNAVQFRDFLVSKGVPEVRIVTASFDGEVARPHPRDLIVGFLKDSSAAKLVIYYAGHALEDGTWCLRWLPERQNYAADVFVAPHDLFAWKASLQPSVPLEVINDAPAAGAWCLAAKKAHLHGRVLAACSAHALPLAQNDGSLFTSWLLGRGRSLRDVLRPGSSAQSPWEYGRLGTVGPLRV